MDKLTDQELNKLKELHKLYTYNKLNFTDRFKYYRLKFRFDKQYIKAITGF